MLALRIRINDEEPVTGGAEDLGVISAGVTAVGLLGNSSYPSRPDERPDIFCQLSGATARKPGAENEHLHWVKLRFLNVGDRVVIDIVETDSASPIVDSTVHKSRNKDVINEDTRD
ncbi:MAG: hypothetical protein JWN70_888 [Planctomycetaceae bacterium]|nr:hypothetical protein [Planctomycetaceae bacterium]